MTASERGRAAGLRSIPDLAQLFEGLFFQLPIALEVFAADGTCVLVNDAFRRLFGAAPAPGYRVFDDAHLTAAGLLPDVRRAFAGEVVALRTPISSLHPSPAVAGTMAIQTTALPVRGKDGEIGHVVFTYRDADGEERALAAEREQRELLRLVLDSISEGVLVADRDGKMLLANPAATGISGVTVGAHPRTERWSTLLQIFKGDQVTPFPAEEGTLIRALRGERSDDVEMCVKPDGREARFLRSSGRPLVGADGQLRGGVTVMRDVTAEVIARQELAASRAAWQALVANAPDAILRLDTTGRIQFVNRVGSGVGEILGRSWLDFVPPESRDLLTRALEHTCATGEPGSWETPGLGEDGQPAWYSSHLGPIFDGDRVVGAVLVARDITERKHAEAQLMISDRMASVGTLAAGVAHEINNPLAAVMANVEIVTRQVADLVARGEASPELLDELRDAHDGVQRVRHIVRDLRLFSRGEDEHRAPVDVQRVLESTLRIAWNEVKHRARLITHYGDTPPVLATESRLGQVFLNLLVNAAQAIREGDADHHTITVATATRPDGRVAISVRDTGAGIPEAVRARVFTPFFTTKEVGGGAGLGLSICHRIVTGLGGELSFVSEVGRGTEFTVVLPAAPVVELPPPPPLPTPPTVPPSTGKARRGRVLVVDDEPIVTRSVKRALDRDHDVIALNSPRQALDAIVAGARFDLILCDLMMPEMTGMDLYAELERVAPELVPRVVFLTGGAFTPRAREFLDGVANLILEKPFGTAELRATVAERVK